MMRQALSFRALALVTLILGSTGRTAAQAAQLHLALDIWYDKPTTLPKLQRREQSGPILERIDNGLIWYFANITVGTPGQVVRLRIEPGESDTYVNTASSTACMEEPNPCLASGTYEPNSSLTYSYLSSDFIDNFDVNVSISGDWATDIFTIGNVNIDRAYFGIAYNAIPYSGVLGIGYPSLDTASVVTRPNILQVMLNEGLTSSLVYSLWLDTIESPRGQLIFGGVDTGKFLGTLETIPMFAQSYEYSRVSVGLSKLELSHSGVSHAIADFELQVELDTYAADIWLPDEVVSTIYAILGISSESGAHPQVPCSWKLNATTLDFTLGSFFISIPMNQLVLQNYTSPTLCYLPILATNWTNALGIAFLRSVYVVYDFSHTQVSLAQTNSESSISNISNIGPSGVGSLASTVSGSPRTNGTQIHNISGLSVGAKAGIGVGAVLGGLLLCALIFVIFRPRQKREKSALPEVSQIPANPKSPNPTPHSLPPQKLSAEVKLVPARSTQHVYGDNKHRDGISGPHELDSNAINR